MKKSECDIDLFADELGHIPIPAKPKTRKKSASQPLSVDDDWGITDSPLTDSATGDFFDARSSDNSATNQLEKEGWIYVEKNHPLVEMDIIRFHETSWDRRHRKKSEGSRLNVAKIVLISFDKQCEAKIHFEILESTGTVPLSAGAKRYRYQRNIVRWNCYRKCWVDETIRQEIVEIAKTNFENIQREILPKEAEDGMMVGNKCRVGKKMALPNESNMMLEEAMPSELPLSADEQQWIDCEWQKDVTEDMTDHLRRYRIDKGWKQMGGTNDCVVVNDIIWFFQPNFTARYPYGKYCSRSIVIAKVLKVAREYYHFIFIVSRGNKPYTKKNIFRRKFETVQNAQPHRLLWVSELSRKDCLGKQIKMPFGSQQGYEDYIKESEGNCKNLTDDINEKSSNNLKIKKGEKIMEQRLEVSEWMEKQKGILGGVFIENGCYAKMSRGRVPYSIPISNFALKAEAMIVQNNHWLFECTVVNRYGIVGDRLILSRDDLQSAAAFKRALASDSHLLYYGDGKDTTHIQGLLTNQQPPLKHGIDKLGIHQINGRCVYVEGDRVVDHNGSVDDVVFTRTNIRQDDVPTLLQQPDITENELRSIAKNLNKFNEPSIAYLIVAWIGFCFIKNRLAHKVNNHNPILLCQGEPGVGKTETISRIVQPIFSSQRPIINVGDMTKFTLAENGNRSNFVPCCYDEWKYSVMSKTQIKELDSMVLAAYNQTTLSRGKADQTVNEYRFTSPHIIMGEMTMDSVSLQHRRIELFFNYKGRSGTETYFRNLCQLPLASFGKGLLLHMLSLSDATLDSVFDEQRRLVDPLLDDRFAENATLVRVGLWLITDYFTANGISTADYAEGYSCIDNIIKESLQAARVNNVDKILIDFSLMSWTRNCSGNWLKVGEHYEIRDGKLYIKIAEAYEIYLRYARSNDVSAEKINKSSFLQQLKTRPYYQDKKTYRIGNAPCNAVCIDLSAIPAYMEVNFAA